MLRGRVANDSACDRTTNHSRDFRQFEVLAHPDTWGRGWTACATPDAELSGGEAALNELLGAHHLMIGASQPS